MAALDTDIGFEDILRRTAEIIEASAGKSEPIDRPAPQRPVVNVIFWAIVAGLGLAAALTLVTGYTALISDTPGIWIHRLMALMILQSVLVAAVATKLSPQIESGNVSVRVAVAAPEVEPKTAPAVEHAPPAPAPVSAPKLEPNLGPATTVMMRKPVVGGVLAGREYLTHSDGTIEIDTLVGRRRFVSIEAAKEFVGS